MRNSTSHYTAVAQALHWLTAILVLAAYALSRSDRYSLYSAGANEFRIAHETLGVLVIVVVALKILWRQIDKGPAKRPMLRWMTVASKCIQFALYLLLITIPATAMLGTWLEGIPVTLPGFEIATPMERTDGLGQLIMQVHITLGNVIPWVAGIHAAAAFFHHFYLRDDVLRSMVPGRYSHRRRNSV